MADESEVACVQCGGHAVHEANTGTQSRPRWVAYCCDCFAHDWPGQRLIPGRECVMELVEVPVTTTRRQWRRREAST